MSEEKELHEMSFEELGKLFPIIISEHDPKWKNKYKDEKSIIENAISKENIVRINHYGSTSVPDLLAKPTIDILLEIKDDTDLNILIKNIKSIDYMYSPQPDNPAPHMMFMKGYTNKGFVGQAFHLHVRYRGDWDELYFRDYLLNHKETAQEYGRLKLQLKEKFEHDREGYTQSKGEFIKAITKKARQESGDKYSYKESNIMKEISYKKIDAFTSGSSLGNPAACLYLGSDQTLSEDEMQNIAKQHKGFVSEVVYCKQNNDGFDLTYYSSECEVDFCGHGTIACMYDVIKNTPEVLNKDEVLIRTNKKGVLKVYNDIRKNDAVYITAPDPDYLNTTLKAQEIADALEIKSDKISKQYPIDFINAGLATLIVPIEKLEDEINIFPSEKKLKDFCLKNDIDIILIFSKETARKESIAHTRVFAPKFGYLEDPATGSGNSAFGYYMLKNNIWFGENVSIEQGGKGREFNTVKLSLKENKVLFGGSATTRIIGKYYI